MFNKSLLKLFTLLFILSGQISRAAEKNTSTDFMQALSEELEKNSGELSKTPGISTQNNFDNIPLAEPKGAVPPECNPHEFTTQSLANYENAHQFSQSAKQYFDHCSKYLTAGNNVKGLLGLIKFSTIKYDLMKNPLIQFQTLTLSDGSQLDAFIGVKDSVNQRPWIILKCGVFCDINTSPSMFNFVINFFDQSPFNIIFVSNYTGSDYIRKNSSLRLGGFYEVYDFYDVAQWLKYESPYKNTVDSIHAVGVSLGGSAALAVSHLQNLYQSKNGDPLFNSTTAICPVVNLGPTLQDMYADSNKGKIFTALTWKYLKQAAPYLHDAHDYLDRMFPPKSELFPSMLTDIVLRYGRTWEASLPPGRSAPIPESADDFWNKNSFSKDDSNLQIPTFAWASADDHVVNFDLNTKTLINKTNSPPTLGALGVELGDHCGFATAYGYSSTTSVLQSFVLNNSPNFKVKAKIVQTHLPSNTPSLSKNERHLRQWWMAEEGSSTLTLHYETFDPNRHFGCRFTKPYKSGVDCRRHYTQSIPIASLPGLELTPPTNATESQILIRKLNGIVRVSNDTTPVDGTNLLPTHFTWRGF